MDFNLEKIIEHNKNNIKKGSLGIPLRQGQDYLHCILCDEDGDLGNNRDKMIKEMNEFANVVRSLTPSHLLRSDRRSSVIAP